MAKFEDSMKILMGLEFNGAYNALEINKTENDVTYMGIYRVAHPEWSGWAIVDEALSTMSVKEASKVLFENKVLTEKVYKFYKDEFWTPFRFDEIVDQKKADEMFVFGVNAGMVKAIKLGQEIVGVVVDGRIGKMTIAALNSYDVVKFDKEYDAKENEHYAKIIAANPAKKIFAKGWRNRAEAV